MQDCLAIQQELPELLTSRFCEGVSVIASQEPWNPVAAVILRQVILTHCTPSTVDIRIPIPNLYAFTNSVYVILNHEKVSYLNQNGAIEPIPGYHKLGEECISNHSKQFVDFREQTGWTSEMYTLFLTPEWNPEGFRHTTLTQFLVRLLDFFKAPREFIKREIEYCAGRWKQTASFWWLVRSGQLYAELGEFENAREMLVQGQRLFPRRHEFRQLLKVIPS